MSHPDRFHDPAPERGLSDEAQRLVIAQLERRLEAERLIASIAAQFVSAPGDSLDEAIDLTLQRLGEFSQADRTYVFQLTSDYSQATNTHEWCAAGVEPQIHNLQSVPLEEFRWFMGRLHAFQPVSLTSMSELSDDAVAERLMFEAQSIQSIVCVPMVVRGMLLGFLGFDAVRQPKAWQSEDIGLLQMVAQLIAASLERERIVASERSLARLEGVLLAARTAQHELNNQLAIVIGYAEAVADDPRLPAWFRPALADILSGAEAAVGIVGRLRRITHVVEVDRGAPDGPVLDLDAPPHASS
ncbi:MAG: GAF domain-containing protein [Chloroflexi bacterium]|nr:GAF domain-containing protein [Chloroflexota bacterium]